MSSGNGSSRGPSGPDRAETPEQARARLEREGRAGRQKPALPDFGAVAAESIAKARAGGILDERERRRERDRAEHFEARRDLYLRNFLAALPVRYRDYASAAPVRTLGNAAALTAANDLELGRSLHLYGESGTAKTHIAVWTCARLIRSHAVGVKFLDECALDALAYRFDEPPDFLQEAVILADDLDKVAVSPRASASVNRLLKRPEHDLTLISTANRPKDALARRYGADEPNLLSVISRLSYVLEVEVTGPDYRPLDAARRSLS